MAQQTEIFTALQRNRVAFQRKPAVAQGTTHNRTVSQAGFTAVSREGSHEFSCDMPQIMGGGGGAPTPGVLGRACLASCIVMGIRLTAEAQQVPVGEIAVDLSMDWDQRGLLGMDGVSAGPGNIQVQISLDSPAAQDVLDDLVAEALKNDPWFIALQAPHEVKIDLNIKEEA